MVDAAFFDRIEPRPDLATAVALELSHRPAVVTTSRGFRQALRRRSPRLEAAVGYPPLSEMSDAQRREFHDALLDADAFQDLPGKWQAAILTAEAARPQLRAGLARQHY
jgi:hypothetical protein